MSRSTIRSAGASFSDAVSHSVNRGRCNDSSSIASEYALHDQRLRPPRREPIRQGDHLVTYSREHRDPATEHGVDADGRDGSRLHHEQAENTGVTLAGNIGERGRGCPGRKNRDADAVRLELFMERFTEVEDIGFARRIS